VSPLGIQCFLRSRGDVVLAWAVLVACQVHRRGGPLPSPREAQRVAGRPSRTNSLRFLLSRPAGHGSAAISCCRPAAAYTGHGRLAPSKVTAHCRLRMFWKTSVTLRTAPPAWENSPPSPSLSAGPAPPAGRSLR